MKQSDGAAERNGGVSPWQAPSISLPKGGGAIRGVGEKFGANPVTGAGSMSVPIALSPGRSGFGPQLSLSYDSGAGNGAFGLGWNLSTPAITRKTDKGLPQYKDAEESDVFILSGAEDLAPQLVEVGGQWRRDEFFRSVNGVNYHVQRYRPRVEGLFARIERWTNEVDPQDSFWRSISKDNITTLYGKTDKSRIADPADPALIFTWLIYQSYDDKGNAVVYDYVEENSDGLDLSQAHEKNRTHSSRSANRYLKRIRYGNRQPNRDRDWNAFDPMLLPVSTWMFDVVFDYGDHDIESPLPEEPGKQWPVRNDPFSSYRSGFEVRTYRLCQRVLMFHHFPYEEGVGQDCLVRSTDFTYSYEENPADSRNPIFSFLLSVTQSGYKRQNVGYLKKSLPPIEFDYTEAAIDETLQELDPESLENLPYGLGDGRYQWVDLDGEGLSGVLTEQADGWFYKRNLSPINTRQESGRETVAARFAPVELVAQKPSLAAISSGRQQLLDLAGDGQVDLVEFEGPTPGFYERTEDEYWETFVPFTSLPNLKWDNQNLKFVDLTGDGHADILISEDEAFCWHPSLAEAGFGPPERVRKALDEEKGPKLVLADGAESIYLSDMSGDGLTDLVRIRNGEVCYWPNLGYGRFGAKVTMDNAPWFDRPDLFDQRRIRLADIDGAGVTDILYLSRRGVQAYFNQSGNSWSAPTHLTNVPPTDNVKSVMVVDLLGNGTACLVWSSPLASDVRQPMRYLDLMGGQKPHLLIKEVNNLGAETRVQYAPSTKFYLADKLAGTPWVTRLPFPVHVAERVETLDRISGNRFVTRYAYHHGYFDGPEREFRGFGMVEQWDTEEFSALTAGGTLPDATNIDEASHVPPALTRTWFHTGAFLDESRISKHFEHEYYREGDTSEGLTGLTDEQLRALLLDDTLLPATIRLTDGARMPYALSNEEVLEACRALKGAVLRQEIYALDGSDEADRPYSTSERNYTIELLQPRDGNRHAVFFTHAREQLDFHYERKLADVNGQKHADPRVSHAMTLEVDAFGNALRSVAIGYRRRDLPGVDASEQKQTHLTFAANRFTNRPNELDWYRVGLPVEAQTYEIAKPPEPTITDTRVDLFRFDQIAALAADLFPLDQVQPPATKLWPYEKWDWRQNAANAPPDARLRLIEHTQSLYRRDDLTGPLPLGEIESLALPFESYKLAFTPGLLDQIYVRGGQKLLPANPADILEGGGGDRGGYVHREGDENWWIPSGRIFFSQRNADNSDEELAYARQHFFLPHRYRDPFHTASVSTESFVTYDTHDLLMLETSDALGNRVTAGERDVDDNLTAPRNDYRVLQPKLITDPNRNRTEVAFDTLGMVAGTAVKGKDDTVGDNLTGLDADLTPVRIDAFYDADDPHTVAADLLKDATTRIIYDLDRFKNSGRPVFAATLARETHVSDPLPPDGLKIQIGFSYSDGFGREIQKKIRAEPGPLVEGGPPVSRRWVGSGWTIFNNKGKPVRQYEPFFSQLAAKRHQFEFNVRVGVSPVLVYDPVERVIATLHANHTWEKVVFDAWRQETWDVNDTVLVADPRTDPDVGDFFHRLPNADYLPTWYDLRTDPANAATFAELYPDPTDRANETRAAEKTGVHADTPTVAHADSLGRTFLTVAHNKFKYSNAPPANPPVEEFYDTRVTFDIEGNQREVIDAKGRVVMRYDYDMLGNRIHQASMEAGERWMLNDVAGKPIYAWDSRDHQFRTAYDQLRRPVESSLLEGVGSELLIGRTVYGETVPNPATNNLRGKVVQVFDQAGLVTTDEYDFKGNLLQSQRQFVELVDPQRARIPAYKTTVNWFGAVELEVDIYTSRTRYDALNRPTEQIAPHTPAMQPSVYSPTYNEANLLEKVDVSLRGAAAPTPFVKNIDYNAKGQRTRIDYGNEVTTTYDYDPTTFRLTHLLTTRNAVDFPDDCPTSPPNGWPGCQVQNLHYTYDPAGNITHIRDDAQQTIFFRNQRVEPSTDYTYDAIYRLMEATGREHLGQGGAPIAHSYNDVPRIGLHHPNEDNAMGRYTERYVYDEVGNFQEMRHHRSGDLINPAWTRAYAYYEDSLLEPGKQSNRLSSTTVGNGNPTTEQYDYDAHGNMLRMPQLQIMQFDFKDQLQMTQRQAVNDDDEDGLRHQGERTYYVYDAGGQRVRKVTERQAAAGQTPTRMKERIYLSGFEVYREYGADGITITLERESLHVMDDKQRVALVETRTQGNDGSLRQLTRYQFGNHLGSASLELDHEAQIISYEEYVPYGSTSYQAVRSQIETAKRYRYTGMERDEESGLSYHNARYYSPPIAIWISFDPKFVVTGVNIFAYTNGNPVRRSDRNGMEYEDIGEHLEAERQAVHDARPELGQSAIPSVPAGPQVTYAIARRIAAIGQRAFRLANAMTGGIVQAGHTMDVKTSIATQLPAQTRDDPRTMMALHSRRDPRLAVKMTTTGGQPGQAQAGESAVESIPWQKTYTRHTGQEVLRGQAQDRAAGRTGGTLTREGQVAASQDVLESTKNTTWDQRNVTRVLSSPRRTEAEAIESSPAVARYRQGLPIWSSPPESGLAGATATVGRNALPYAAEAEVGAVSLMHLSYSRGLIGLGEFFEATAIGTPIVAGGLVAGFAAGNLAEAGAKKLGATEGQAEAAGIAASILGPAALGAVIGGPAGAVIGGAIGFVGYEAEDIFAPIDFRSLGVEWP